MSQLKYQELNDLVQLVNESSNNPSSSNDVTSSSLTPSPRNPPSYVSVIDQPQSLQSAPTIEGQIRGSLNLNNPHLVHNHREIPLTQQPQGLINTSVVTSQPKRPWKTSLCDCCASWSVCMCVTCCPMCYTCSLSRRLEENCCLACCPGGLAIMRSNVRRWHNIEGSSMDDVCMSCWCRCCVLCQMGNELNAHKYGKICCC